MTRQKFLFIHQNFPGQFVHVVGELVRLGHDVVALGIKGRTLPGVRYIRYAPKALGRISEVELTRDFETKILRGLACAEAMEQLKESGFTPNTVVAHPGWGEALFCKDVWPGARLIMFAEFFYSADGADYNFDAEFAHDSLIDRARLRLKNSVHLHALHTADAAYTPTQWQLSQLPVEYHPKLNVIFDGIDTAVVAPKPQALIQLKRDGLRLTQADEVITFVNRNLEPYRGFHVFMRALPEILKQRPKAHCLIVGRDEVSYGSAPKGGGSWRQVMLAEVGAQLPMERVHFLGHLAYQDYLRVIQISTCHVYLTYPFVLSWSCLEAMSAGRVVVASNTEPVQEVIEHGINGLLFDFFDAAALSKQVIDVLADPGAYRDIGKRARNTVVERYDLKTKCLPQQIDLIGRLASR
ncbi:MAG: glycosyltransferase [Rhodoferax sp.]|uniref:glycosyltransferase n=1 Tax=Rhodoferax sp. TaxID=50421 RepID=UPI00262329FA|nr:glycosyltransferase [Rhodoferax sp.]MDD5333963.1 glycosyltransferase [Rhodoferax sp.]